MFDETAILFKLNHEKVMVNPICKGCGNQVRHGTKYKVGYGLEEVFGSARLLCHVDSNDPLCQHCQFKFFSSKQEMLGDFDDIIVNGNGRNGCDIEINDSSVSSRLYSKHSRIRKHFT